MEPKDKKLYSQVKKEADAKFVAPTSAYKSAWIVREYKKRHGTYVEDSTGSKEKEKDRGLVRWFREKWVDLNRPGQPCGRSKAPNSSNGKKDKYPLCRPTVKVTNKTPKLAQEIGEKEIRKANREKQKIRETGHIRFVSPSVSISPKNKEKLEKEKEKEKEKKKLEKENEKIKEKKKLAKRKEK